MYPPGFFLQTVKSSKWARVTKTFQKQIKISLNLKIIIRLTWIEMENKEPLSCFIPLWSFISNSDIGKAECDLEHVFMSASNRHCWLTFFLPRQTAEDTAPHCVQSISLALYIWNMSAVCVHSENPSCNVTKCSQESLCSLYIPYIWSWTGSLFTQRTGVIL